MYRCGRLSCNSECVFCIRGLQGPLKEFIGALGCDRGPPGPPKRSNRGYQLNHLGGLFNMCFGTLGYSNQTNRKWKLSESVGLVGKTLGGPVQILCATYCPHIVPPPLVRCGSLQYQVTVKVSFAHFCFRMYVHIPLSLHHLS